MKKTTLTAFGAFALLAVSASAQAADQVPLWEKLATGQTAAVETTAPVVMENPMIIEDALFEGEVFEPVAAQAESIEAPQKMSLWDQMTGKKAAPAPVKTVVAPVAATAPAEPFTLSKGDALIEIRGYSPVVIEIRERTIEATPVAAAPIAQEVQTQAQEIAAAQEATMVADTFVAEETAFAEEFADEEAAIKEIAVQDAPVIQPVMQEQPRQKMSLWAQLTGKKAASVDAAEAYTAPVATAPVMQEAQGAVALEAAPVPLWEKLAVDKPSVQ